jgi:NAD(P) transhydrogenase subunit beta
VTDVMNDTLIPLAYLFAAGCFVLALKWLSHPTTARRGVRTGEVGMLVAVVATLFHEQIVEFQWIAVAIVAGVALGAPLGLLVPMTSTCAGRRSTSPRWSRSGSRSSSGS